ncbi:MAG: hypothetical protein ACI9Y1_000577 [Lentisphaeria bacterium]
MLPDKTLKFTEQPELGNAEKLVSQSGKEPHLYSLSIVGPRALTGDMKKLTSAWCFHNQICSVARVEIGLCVASEVLTLIFLQKAQILIGVKD